MGLKEDLDTVPVSQMSLRKAVTVSSDVTVRDAVEAMRDGRLGCAVVVNAEEQAEGIFTEGMLRHALNESESVLNQPIHDQMIARLPWVLPTDPVRTVLDAMEEHNIRFIVVLDDDRHVLGITGQKTLMEFIASYFPQEVFTQDPTGVTYSVRREGA